MMASETTPETVAERLDAHYAAALQAIRVACRDHQADDAKIDATGDDQRGVWQAPRDVAVPRLDRALGAAAAFEELADVLGVVLADGRQRHFAPLPLTELAGRTPGPMRRQ